MNEEEEENKDENVHHRTTNFAEEYEGIF